jgi:hypothetical protein
MRTEIKRMDVEAACEDIRSRSLAGIRGELARLIYLASMRDYNTGQYYHEGLALSFTETVAGMALAACHREIFRHLAFSPLEDLVQELDAYLRSTHAQARSVLDAWRKLEPYRVTIPSDCDALSAEFFFSNLRIALAILEARQPAGWSS